MSGGARLAVTWCAEGVYELSVGGAVARQFRAGEVAAWQDWLDGVTSLRFCGIGGRLGLYREARPRGGAYWYAYHTAGGRTRKRYLGATSAVTLARLEEIAAELADAPPPAPAVPAPPGRTPAGEPDTIDIAGAFPAAKFVAPQPPPALVPRERLLAALDAAPATTLTLVVAPAGWGKTTALAAWAARRRGRVAWLALESADDDPARFWSAVIAALRARLPGIGATALALLRAPRPAPLGTVVTALRNELEGDGAREPLVLVLDDYQAIADPALHEGVASLLAPPPARLRLLIASRADPDLPLARLRGHGQLVELRAAELAFDREEAGVLLQRSLGAPLADDEVAALAARTEGWAAGLQLAALALRHYPDRAAWLAGFTGGHRFLLDYVEEEVLERQPPAIRDFLLRAAVLTRLGADVCEAVTGEAASRAILDTLERDNLFLVPLDEQRQWYRLHDLFREALLARAAGEPGLVADAHGRAARWHAAHGDGREAIAHALAGEDHDLAADLIAREAPRLWLAGEARAVVASLRALPDAILRRHARLALDAALRYMEVLHATADTAYADARYGVEQLLGRLEEWLRAPGTAPLPAAEVARLRRRLRLLRALTDARALLARGDAAGLATLAAEAAELAAGEEVRWQMIRFGLLFWLSNTLEHEGPRLLPQLLALQDRALEAGEYQAALTASVWLTIAYVAAGQLHAADRVAEDGLALVGRLGIQTASAGYLHLALTYTGHARNRPGEAAGSLRALLAIARTWQQIDLLILAHYHQARLALLRGDSPAADTALREAEALIQRERLTHNAPSVAAARVRYWLATGDLASAARWAALAAVDAPAVLARARVALAQRHHAEALATLDDHAARLDRPGDVPTAAEYLALRLLALHHAGEGEQVRAVAARLLALTRPEGWLRVYLDEGAPMEAALAALLDARDGETPDVPALPRAHLAQILATFAAERSPEQPVASVQPPLVEALTRREREVLRLLATGAANAAIAAALSISPFTVKRHVGSLLGKLGATSRTGAVERARRAGLL